MAPVQLPRRVFGKVDEYGGELIATLFWRLWFLPLVPRASVWISTDERERGRQVRWHGRSIAAGYLRTWAPIVWLFAFAVDTSRAYTISGVAVALCAWSWSWRMSHRHKAQLRSDFDRVALGSQCPPELLLREDLEQLFSAKQEELAARGAERSPEDIARFGSDDLGELITAYAVLRLAAARHRPSGPWRLAAQRILDGRHDPAEASDGVFRSRVVKPLGRDEIARAVSEAAARQRAHLVVRADGEEKTLTQYVLWESWLRFAGYAALAGVAWLGASQLADVQDPDQFEVITERRLRDTIATGKTEYRVRCEELHLIQVESFDGYDLHACKLGNRYLPVLAEDGLGIRRHPQGEGGGATVRGRLHPRRVFSYTGASWESDFRRSKYEDLSSVVYLRTDVFSKTGQITLALSYLLGAPLLLLLWIRLYRQRRRMIATAEQLLEEERREAAAAHRAARGAQATAR